MILNYSLAQPTLKTSLKSESDTKHTLVVEPLLPGYGYTLGNTIRRVLLSSIPGSAVTRIRINEIAHEYQPIDGVVEDALDVVLNLKQIRCKILTNDDKVILTLNKNKGGEVTAADFAKNPKVELVNPDAYICYLNDSSKLEVEIEISRGIGYLSIEEINLADNTNPQDIYIDASFNPVTNVALNVEQVRVGEKTNYDKLEITFETDKSIEAQEVVDFVFSNLIDLFNKILSGLQSSTDNQAFVKSHSTTTPSDTQEVVNTINEEINLPARIKSILEKNGITTNSELTSRVSEVESFAGITEKSFSTIQDYIKTIS